MNFCTANVNPITGINYGIISGASLDSDIAQEIFERAYWIVLDAAYKEALIQELKNIDEDCEFDLSGDVSELEELANEHDLDLYQISDSLQIDEPEAEFEYDGAKIATSFLGGAMNVFVLESTSTGWYNQCSICVPNAGNLDEPVPAYSGVECYDVPKDWRSAPMLESQLNSTLTNALS